MSCRVYALLVLSGFVVFMADRLHACETASVGSSDYISVAARFVVIEPLVVLPSDRVAIDTVVPLQVLAARRVIRPLRAATRVRVTVRRPRLAVFAPLVRRGVRVSVW